MQTPRADADSMGRGKFHGQEDSARAIWHGQFGTGSSAREILHRCFGTDDRLGWLAIRLGSRLDLRLGLRWGRFGRFGRFGRVGRVAAGGAVG